jgi:hypothetical protein
MDILLALFMLFAIPVLLVFVSVKACATRRETRSYVAAMIAMISFCALLLCISFERQRRDSNNLYFADSVCRALAAAIDEETDEGRWRLDAIARHNFADLDHDSRGRVRAMLNDWLESLGQPRVR